MSLNPASLNERFHDLDSNPEFVSVFEAIEGTPEHVFVTGRAGTGKSTLLQYYRHKTRKSIAVLAPTGVAAINVQGQTIHSFFMFRPDITPETVAEIFVPKVRRRMYRELQALVIDEISMVRADVLDCVDAFLRLHGPDPTRPFGGVQMIFFGDLYQLPPVVRQTEQEIFRTYYRNPYFFGAKVFSHMTFKMIELKDIYRQKDPRFIGLLDAIRKNEVTDEQWRWLNTRCLPDFEPAEEDFFIALTTTNALAEAVNARYLARVREPLVRLSGVVSGDFERRNLPTPETLEFKVGAQVMMLNNDLDKRWVNGTIGRIVKVVDEPDDHDIIMVKLADGTIVDIQPFTWELFEYYFEESTQALSSRVIGYFTQYPLKLAWAVTIHKSQGQTFDRVVVDVGKGTFAHGQLYVALSRCTSLEGIVLKRPIHRRHILTDPAVANFLQTLGETHDDL